MKRREFLAATAGLSLIPAIGWASTEYTPGLVDKELAAGKTVFLDFKTTNEWLIQIMHHEQR